MRVLVVHPPVSVSADFIDYPYFSDLGAVQVASVLDAAGYEVQLVDAYALPTSTLTWRDDGRAHLGATVSEVLERCGQADAVAVAYTPFHRPPHRDDVLGELLVGLREKLGDVPLLLADMYQSGQHYVQAPELLRAYPEATAYLQYEAEVTLGAWLEDPQPGLLRGTQPELDALPFPRWDWIDLGEHRRFRAEVVAKLGRGHWAFPIEGDVLPLVTSRGCPFRCTHCSSNPDQQPGEPKAQRRYSPEKLSAYLEHLKQLGAQKLFVLDELINVKQSHFDHFLEESARLDLRFDVPNGFRADYLEEHHFARMRGRVTTVSVSAESGSKRVLQEVVDKQLELGAIERAASAAHRAGVPLMVHYMIGLPTETAEEVNQTLRFALDLWDEHRAWPAVQFATPLPGTELAKRQPALDIVDDWGPRFQRAPSKGALSAEQLETFKRIFMRRLHASGGAQKLIMNVTYVCNNHCTFCAVGTRTQVDGFPPRQKEQLDKYRRHGITMVDFDGGEPTLNPELVGLIRYAKRLGYQRINVTTNGRLLAYEDFARKLVQSGLTTLLFSLHGPDLKSHAREVGVAEAFDQTLAGIRHARAHKPDDVELGVNVTLTKTNYKKLPALAQLVHDEGLRWLNIQFLTPFGRATQHHAPDTEDAARITAEVIDTWRHQMKIQVINLPWCYLPGHEAHLVGDSQKLARHMIFVNNETVNLADYLAQRRIKKPICQSCEYASFCSGFYQLEDVPEPEWLVTPESLTRKVDTELLR